MLSLESSTYGVSLGFRASRFSAQVLCRDLEPSRKEILAVYRRVLNMYVCVYVCR